MKRLLSLILLLVLASSSLTPQTLQVSVDQNFNSQPLPGFIKYIENKYSISFFFSRSMIDTIMVIQNSAPSTLEAILSKSLRNSGITFFEDHRNIILTYRYRIQPDLPESFINAGKIVVPGNAQPEAIPFLVEKNENIVKASKTYNPGVITVGVPGKISPKGNARLSGIITEQETGQPIPGVVISLSDINRATLTDQYGYYILIMPLGKHNLDLKFLGRRDQSISVNVLGDGKLDLSMEEKILELKGVVINADRDFNVRGLQLGFEKIDIQTIKQMASTLGEGDLMKTALLLPGVKTVGEGASGFNVRGGGTDQNLVLMDESPVFNSSHLFGFFSVFNPDVVRDFSLYKSGIPAQYGGRLSSVLDVNIRNGDLKKLSVYGGISPVSGRLTVDGPIIKDKASFLVSARGSYSDWVLHRTRIPSLANSDASFIDLNGKIGVTLNEKNHITLSAYYSTDQFRLNSDTLYKYRNINASLSLKHTFSDKLFGLFSEVYSNYAYNLSSFSRVPYSFILDYNIKYLESRTDFTWFSGNKQKLTFGASVIRYRINPGSLIPGSAESLIMPKKVAEENAFETGLYISDEYDFTNALSVSAGLRYSGFFSLGPSLVYNYPSDAPRSLLNRNDPTYYGKNRITDFEGGPELRLLLRYKTGPSSSVKLSYTNMNQFLQMMSNTTAISPTDIWRLSGPNLPAQRSRQVSAGYYRYIMANKVLSSIEVYYKTSKNILEYRGGTNIVMNPDLEVDLLGARGKAYGVEVMLKKDYGAFNGWISYTYSRSLIKTDSKYLADQINQGAYFPSNYDKPHDFTLVSNYRFSRLHSISSTITYSTGRPITYPVALYRIRDREVLHYSNRNEYRIPDYFRWDMAVNFEGKLNRVKLWQNNMSISVYNITGRHNAYSIFFVSDQREGVKGYKLSVFSQPIITVTYDFRF